MPVEGLDGAYEIPATDRVTFAWASLGPGPPYVEVADLGAAQAESLYPCTMPDERFPLGGDISGLVRGLAPGDTAYVVYGGAYTSPSVGSDSGPAFFQFGLVSGLNDLLAIRYPKGHSTQFDRLIVRRDPAYQPGAQVDLDFASAEAAAPEPFTLSWNGPPAIVQETLWSPSLGRLPIGAHFIWGAANGPVTSPQTLFTAIRHVVNYDIPEMVEDYIRRGRTARGEMTGLVSTIASWMDKEMIREIERALCQPLARCTTPRVEPYLEVVPRRRMGRRR